MPPSLPRRGLWGAAIVVAALGVLPFVATSAWAEDEPRTEPRLELIRADGTTEPLAIARVAISDGGGWRGAVDLRHGSKSFATAPGAVVFFVTKDSRAAFDRIVVRVPDPVPAVLTARVPAIDHPRIRDVTLVILDEKTERALAEAAFEAGESNAAILSQHADENGRVTLHEVGGKSGYLRWYRRGYWIHAPAHVGWEGPRWSAPDASEVEDVLAGRPIPVRLTPIVARVRVEERRLRIAGAEGAPVAGAFVWIPWTIANDSLGSVFGSLGYLCDGFRRTGADGIVSIPVFPGSRLPVAGLEVRLPTADTDVGGVPFLAYGLAYDALPKDEVREMRLPPVATVELTIEGLPPDGTVEIGADALGNARTPVDGPVDPTIYDPGVQEKLANFDSGLELGPTFDLPKPKGAVIAACAFDLRGWFRSGGTPYRRPIPVGRATTLWIDRPIGPRDADGEVPVERRRLDVAPDKPGPLKITRRWEELPVAK